MTVPSQSNARIAAAFWLLAAAWSCANIRPAAVGSVFNWLVDGARFSHQQRLTIEVAELLGGEKASVTVSQSEPASKPPPLPPTLPDNTFKKLEVPLSRGTKIAAASMREAGFSRVDRVTAGRERAAPPHGPPRVASVG